MEDILTGAYAFGDGRDTRLCIIDHKPDNNRMNFLYCYPERSPDYPEDGLVQSGWVYSAGYFDPKTRQARFDELLNYYDELGKAGVRTEAGKRITSRNKAPCESLDIQFPLKPSATIAPLLAPLLVPFSRLTLTCRHENGAEMQIKGTGAVYPTPLLPYYNYLNGIWQIDSYIMLTFVIGENIVVVLAGHGPADSEDTSIFDTRFSVGSGKIVVSNERNQTEIHLTNFYTSLGVLSAEVPPYSRIQVTFPRVYSGERELKDGVIGLGQPAWSIGGPIYSIRLVDQFNIAKMAKHFRMI